MFKSKQNSNGKEKYFRFLINKMLKFKQFVFLQIVLSKENSIIALRIKTLICVDFSLIFSITPDLFVSGSLRIVLKMFAEKLSKRTKF